MADFALQKTRSKRTGQSFGFGSLTKRGRLAEQWPCGFGYASRLRVEPPASQEKGIARLAVSMSRSKVRSGGDEQGSLLMGMWFCFFAYLPKAFIILKKQKGTCREEQRSRTSGVKCKWLCGLAK